MFTFFTLLNVFSSFVGFSGAPIADAITLTNSSNSAVCFTLCRSTISFRYTLSNKCER